LGVKFIIILSLFLFSCSTEPEPLEICVIASGAYRAWYDCYENLYTEEECVDNESYYSYGEKSSCADFCDEIDGTYFPEGENGCTEY